MSDYIQALSLRLCEIMDSIGVSEEERKMNMKTCLTCEILDTMSTQLSGDNDTKYIFGSSSEGSTTVGLDSDLDMLVCNERYPVFENMCEVLPDGYCYLLVRDHTTYPGYVKLQHVVNGVPHNVDNARSDDDDYTSVDMYGRFVRNNKSVYINEPYVDEQNGPAGTRRAQPGYTSVDYVRAYRCKTCPSFASNWITRLRLSNIYPQEFIDLLNSYGCFFVPIGHPFSEEKNLEWRISFSLQERQLMFRLSPIQFKCYVLLKMIKKDLIKREIGQDSLSSYHCKTCILYMVELLPAEWWTPPNLLACVFCCLNTLLCCVNVGFCPNYFIKEENMFARKIQGDVQIKLYQVIHGLLSEGCTFLLRIQCDGLGESIARAASAPLILYPVLPNSINTTTYCMALLLSNDVSIFTFRTIFKFCLNTELRTSISKIILYMRMLQSIDILFEHTREETHVAKMMVLPSIRSIIAKEILAFGLENCTDGNISRSCVSLSLNAYKTTVGERCDFSFVLAFVSKLLFLGQYRICELLLSRLETSISLLVTKCNCNLTYRIEKQTCNGNLLRKISDGNLTVDDTAMYINPCVQFVPHMCSITPDSLRHEMFRSVGTPAGSRNDDKDHTEWYDCAVVDAKVYLFFMQYLLYRRLNKNAHKKVAIDNMEWVIRDDQNLRHKETAYNLLGWIYVQENSIGKAIRCFVKSWKIQPLHNAAKWHIIELLRKANV